VAVQGINANGTAATSASSPAVSTRNLRVNATSGTAPATATGNIRIETASNGAVTVTNTTTPQVRPSVFRRALRALGIGSANTSAPTGTTSTTSTTNP
jgi:hypothetical protein